MIKIDLHVHCSERSSCAQAPQEEMIRSAIAAGLDAVAFTDHFRLPPPGWLETLNQRYAPFRVFTGVEITTDQEDWLVLGVHHPELERRDWTYPELHRFVRARDGYLILAHPFRFAPAIHVDLARHTPDAIEIRSMNTPAAHRSEILAAAQQHHLALAHNSDAHWTEPLGRFYNTFDAALPASDADLVKLLRAHMPARLPSLPD